MVNPTQNRPTGMSRVLYVELLNQQGFILQTRKLKIDDNGQCHGDFALTDSMFAGFYEVRAYTRYMLNFDLISVWMRRQIGWNVSTSLFPKYQWGPLKSKRINHDYYESENYFSRVFPVYDKPFFDGNYIVKKMDKRQWSQNSNQHQPISIKDSIYVTFYPEGGNLIKGLTSRVAFKALDKAGKELTIEGVVLNDSNREVTAFKTLQRGMGFFDFCPKDTLIYKALITYNNAKFEYTLPKCLSEGYTLSATNREVDSTFTIQIEGSKTLPSKKLGLSILSNGNIAWFDTLTVHTAEKKGLIVKSKLLPTGVNRCTLFDEFGQVFAERLIFIQNATTKNVSLKCLPTKQPLKPFEKVQVSFQLTDTVLQPSNFSISIRDKKNTESTYYTENICSYLFMSSELKGYIPDPAYFFEFSDYEQNVALDLLMLTQGWRRYSWKTMSGIQPFKVIEPVEKNLFLDGKTSKWNYLKKKIQLDNDIELRLSLNKGDSLLISNDQKVSKTGAFRFDLPDFMGSCNAILELLPKNKEIKKDRINYDIKYFAEISRFYLYPKNQFTFYETHSPLDSTKTTKNDNANSFVNKGVMLSEFTVRSRSIKHKNYPDFKKPDIIISGKEMLEIYMDGVLGDPRNEASFGFSTTYFLVRIIPEFFHLNVSSYNIFLDNGGAESKLLKDSPTSSGFISNDDRTFIREMKISNIESIHIYLDSTSRDSFIQSFPEAYILIKMKDGATNLNITNTRQTTIQGYSYLSDFYHPDYSKGVPPQTKDYRRTLYWNPNVQTDSTGKASVTFYNNYNCKELEISAEGITKDGVPFVYKQPKSKK